MARLIECEKGQELEVLKLHADEELKQRLISFGIMKGAHIKVIGCAPARKTIEVKVDKMRIALRGEEAELVEVKKV